MIIKNIVRLMFLLFFLGSCKQEKTKQINAATIISKSIAIAGGTLHKKSTVSFDFRKKSYVSKYHKKSSVLQRKFKQNGDSIIDTFTKGNFDRYINNSLVIVSDSMSIKYANSINSVHYFANLPQSLNDAAVHKKLLGLESIKNTTYYKVQVTFREQNGGDDFEDVYIYWFNKKTFKPDYLAYKYNTNGGGIRFRKAYNERYIGGIRFVDYENYKPTNNSVSIQEIGTLFNNNALELLSIIELKNIKVSPPQNPD